jgi:hypothetical protein
LTATRQRNQIASNEATRSEATMSDEWKRHTHTSDEQQGASQAARASVTQVELANFESETFEARERSRTASRSPPPPPRLR